MRIGIFANDPDPIGDVVEERVRARGHEALRISFRGLLRGEPMQVSLDDPRMLDGAFIRHVPSQTALLGPPEQTETNERHWRKQMGQRERHSFALSLLSILELRGARMVNPPVASGPFEHKPFQLAALHAAGLPVPRTLATNDADAVRAFAAHVGPVVVKPIGGGAPARLLDDEMTDRLGTLAATPALFQERVAGTDVRVTVVAGQVVSAVRIPSSTLDYREDPAFASGAAVAYREEPLTDDERALFVRAASVCAHVLSGIDAKRTTEGRLVLLEANAAPVYLEVEEKLGHAITDAIVDALTAP